MSDHLAQALESRRMQVGLDWQEGSFVAGWEAHARSLGAGTPAAQAALREYVRTGLEAYRLNEAFYRAYDAGAGQDDAMRLSIAGVERHERARDAFAALATPTEEGQG